jgi:hypothetical protein
MKQTNYLKLTLTAETPIHDREATSLEPTANGGRAGGHFVVTWTWTFSTKAEGLAALKDAQLKRSMIHSTYAEVCESDFKLSSFKQAFRGVPTIGHFGRASTETLVLAEAS